jgi:mannose-6-phosphate isomerase-like protein (cupin superfamily)
MSTPAPTTTGLKPGDARWMFGSLMIIRATAAETGGAYTLVEVTCPPDLQAPPHVHHREDEGFHVIEGSVDIYVGDESVHLESGGFAFGPRDIPHRFVVGGEGARMLWVLNPGGFEELVEAVSVPAEELTTPPPEVGPPADVGEIVQRYGAELLI